MPVTTRTQAQFDRIFIFGQNGIVPCRYALVCNGSVLLKDGVPDEKWLAESMAVAEREFPEVKRIYGKMLETPERDHAKLIEPFMAYMLSDRAAELTQELSQEADNSLVTVCTHSRKVYCMAKSLTKGMAVKRLKEYLAADTLIAAGDSELDIPMLEAADSCFCAEEIAHLVRSENVTPLPHPLSDGICKALLGYTSQISGAPMQGLCPCTPLGGDRTHEQAHARKAVAPVPTQLVPTPSLNLVFGRLAWSVFPLVG